MRATRSGDPCARALTRSLPLLTDVSHSGECAWPTPRFSRVQSPGRSYAVVAQLAEHSIRNREVVGSTPIGSTEVYTLEVYNDKGRCDYTVHPFMEPQMRIKLDTCVVDLDLRKAIGCELDLGRPATREEVKDWIEGQIASAFDQVVAENDYYEH